MAEAIRRSKLSQAEEENARKVAATTEPPPTEPPPTTTATPAAASDGTGERPVANGDDGGGDGGDSGDDGGGDSEELVLTLSTPRAYYAGVKELVGKGDAAIADGDIAGARDSYQAAAVKLDQVITDEGNNLDIDLRADLGDQRDMLVKNVSELSSMLD